MYLYQDSNNLFYADDLIISPAKHVLKVYNNETVVSLEEVETGIVIFGPIEIIYIQKEDNSYYTDLSDLLVGIENLFTRIIVPEYIDLLTWHKTITDNTFAESIENLPAKFLPRVAKFNGTDDLITFSGAEIADIVTLTIKYSDGTWATINETVASGTTISGLWEVSGTDLIIGNDGSNYFTGSVAYIEGYDSGSNLIFKSITTGQGGFEYDLSGNNNHGTWSGTGDRYTYDLEGSLYANKNGYSLWEHATSPDIQVPFDINGDVLAPYGNNVVLNGGFDSGDNWAITNPAGTTGWAIIGGEANSSTVTPLAGRNMDQIHVLVLGKTYQLEFDVTNPGTVRFYASSLFVDITASIGHETHIFTADSTGFFFYASSSLVTIDNVSIKEVFIPTGYTKTRDVTAGGTKWNMADALVDFDPDNGMDAAVAIFDRSNTTRQTAASRAADDYDASHPYRYQVNEIADPRIYDTYFESAYKDRIFGKVSLDGTDLIEYSEQLNYGTAKTGADLVTVEEYCGIQDFYLPAVIEDGNTVAWYIADDLTTITKDGSDLVSEWADKLGSGHDLLQATEANQPLWSADGILFDGVSEYMKTVGFTFNQPEQIYIVFKQVSWTEGYIFDGNSANLGILKQRTATPLLNIYAGGHSPSLSVSLNTFVISRILFNGINSSFQINEITKITGSFGANNIGGFTLASRADDISYSNIQVKEIILRKIADTTTNEQDIYDYLAAKYSI